MSAGHSRGSRRSLGRGMGLGHPRPRLRHSSAFPTSRVSSPGATGSLHWLARSLRFLLVLGAAVPSSEFPLSPSFPRCDFAPRGLLVTCGGIVLVATKGRGCCWHLVCGGSGCCWTAYTALNSARDEALSVVPGFGNPALGSYRLQSPG